MKTKYWIIALTTPAVVATDQATKWWVASAMSPGERVPVLHGFFDIVFFYNTGAAFGMFSGLSDAVRVPFFYIVAAVAALLLALLYRSLDEGENIAAFAISLVFGGIAGNIIDRIRFGSVVDFLSFHLGDAVVQGSVLGVGYRVPLEWPAFNVADSAITAAMIILVASAIARRREGGGR
ncbi:MAG: signal peptidase II [Proteobacteria bacterium]|nr:signal peptidase II [Pseudomonadota bacterium]